MLGNYMFVILNGICICTKWKVEQSEIEQEVREKHLRNKLEQNGIEK